MIFRQENRMLVVVVYILRLWASLIGQGKTTSLVLLQFVNPLANSTSYNNRRIHNRLHIRPFFQVTARYMWALSNYKNVSKHFLIGQCQWNRLTKKILLSRSHGHHKWCFNNLVGEMPLESWLDVTVNPEFITECLHLSNQVCYVVF